MSVNINLESDNSELTEYLIDNKEKKTGFFSQFGELTKYVPKYGNIENDIATRFGLSSEQNSSGWFQLSRKDRIVGFIIFLSIGVLLLLISSLYIPVLLLKARKFSVIFTLGSVFTFSSLTFLWGIRAFFRHLTASNRIIFTVMYFGSLFLTLFFAMHLQNTILTIIAISFQFLSLISFIVSYLPGGTWYLTKLTRLNFVSSSLPI